MQNFKHKEWQTQMKEQFKEQVTNTNQRNIK